MTYDATVSQICAFTVATLAVVRPSARKILLKTDQQLKVLKLTDIWNPSSWRLLTNPTCFRRSPRLRGCTDSTLPHLFKGRAAVDASVRALRHGPVKATPTRQDLAPPPMLP
jgi:hypothetical protein